MSHSSQQPPVAPPENRPGLPPLLLQAFDQQLALDADGDWLPLHSNIPLEAATTLYQAVRALQPEVTVEIGLGQGIAALAILQALADNGHGVHHAVDPEEADCNDAGLAMVERAGLSGRFQFHRQLAEEVIPQLPQIGFGFVDASRLFDRTLGEFVMLDRKLAVGGCLAFYDMRVPSMQKFLRFVLNNRAYAVEKKFDPPDRSPPSGLGSSAKEGLFRALRWIPNRERILREEFLRPWRMIKTADLVILKKLGADEREPGHYQRF